MKRSLASILCMFTVLACLSPTAANAQTEHSRDGFWFNIGLGYGGLGCDNCDGREGGLSGTLSLGGTISDKLLLGASSNTWTKSEDGVTLTVSTLTAALRFYTSANGGFFLTGGLGVGFIDLEVEGFGDASETGGAALLGLGYDFRVGDNVSITAYWNGFAIENADADANVGQIGVGVTLH